ncbi:MAG: hypothetical protein E6K90_10100 [Thaumarchaeota archaeon]|nr:MAG: hypothetical protein E6K90_10100 [Nitrososphaerota archaeon]
MRRAVSILGAIIGFLGGAMYVLLIQLRSETFRADLPPWMTGALALVGLGIALFLAGLALPSREMGTLDVVRASNYFAYSTVFNTFAAACFSIPVLIPTFEFPILITRWPGIYMVIGYAFFVLIGVLGSLGWSVLYRWLPELFARHSVLRPLFLFQFSTLEVGVYLLSVFMFLGGYVGSALVHQGIGDTIVGIQMEFAVIPSALGIFLVIVSTLTGLANIFLSRKFS